MFELSGLRNLVKTVCAIDRLRLWKHCYHYVCLLVVVWSQSVTCLTLHKHVCTLLRLILKSHIKTTFLFLINFRKT